MRADRRKAALIGGAVVTALALLIAGVLVFLQRDSDCTDCTATPTTSAVAAAGPDLTWRQDPGGFWLPVSREFGPSEERNGATSGFANTELGSALAAIHISTHASSGSGPEVFRPTLARQVVGDHTATMLGQTQTAYEAERVKRALPAGAPLPALAHLSGYHLEAYSPSNALVVVFIEDPTAGLFGFRVSVRWEDGDWRLVAPAAGDFSSVAFRAQGLPPGAVAMKKGA